MKKVITKFFGCLALLVQTGLANAGMIYVSDIEGKVGAWDDATNSGSFLGSLAASGLGRGNTVIGAGWDVSGKRVILTDRSTRRVYGMDATTGLASFLFTSGSIFQGAAVKNGILYGINESTQRMEAYNLSTGALIPLTSAVSVNHSHSTGINPATGQLYVHTSGPSPDRILAMNDNGSIGGIATQLTNDSFYEDIDYYKNDFLAARGTAVFRLDGTTGAQQVFLNGAQYASLGIGSAFGVTVAYSVPAPATLALFGLGLAGLGWSRRKNA
jgi:hypothetical protein